MLATAASRYSFDLASPRDKAIVQSDAGRALLAERLVWTDADSENAIRLKAGMRFCQAVQAAHQQSGADHQH